MILNSVLCLFVPKASNFLTYREELVRDGSVRLHALQPISRIIREWLFVLELRLPQDVGCRLEALNLTGSSAALLALAWVHSCLSSYRSSARTKASMLEYDSLSRRRKAFDLPHAAKHLQTRLPGDGLFRFRVEQLIGADIERQGKADGHLRSQPQLVPFVAGHQRLNDPDLLAELALGIALFLANPGKALAQRLVP